MLLWTTAFLIATLVVAIMLRQGFLRFRRRARAYLSHTVDIECLRDTPEGIVCAVLGFNLEIDLLSTYVVRWRRRLNEAALFADLAAALRRQIPPVVPPPFSLVRDRILPLLKRTGALPPPTGYARENRVLRRMFDEEISIVYMIEGQHRMTVITEGMPAAWQIALDELHRLALHNLRSRTRHILAEIGGPRAEYVSLDGLDASRLLVADLIVPTGVVDPLVAIPHEHACVIAPATQGDQLAARAEELFRSARSPLTTRLYRPSSGPLPERVTSDQ